MAVQGIGGVHIKQLLERLGVKVCVSCYRNLIYPAPLAQTNRVQNQDLIRVRGLPLVNHLYIEVAKALVVVSQAAIAFVKEVFVDGPFLKDGNHMLHAF